MHYPVTHQGKCNCCWAIAAAGNIEALWNIRFKQSVEVSVQELLDCGRCGDGCLGGYVWDAFITVLNYSGLASEKDYRFRGRANIHRCLAPFYKKVAWIQDYVMLPRNEHTMARYVATQGPITVLINQMLLQGYFRLHQGSNTCGITRSPLTACIGDPAEKQQVSCPL